MQFVTLLIILVSIFTSPIYGELFRSQTDYKKPSAMLRAYKNPRNIKSVKRYQDVKIDDLYKYGIIKIEQDNSLIVSETLADQLLHTDGIGSYDADRNYKDAKERARKSDVYMQISYQDMHLEEQKQIWANLGGCRENPSSMKAKYGQGYAVDASAGISGTFKFSLLFGLRPTVGADLAVGGTLSGQFYCEVGPKEKLLMQIKTSDIKVSGIKKRKLKLKDWSIGFATYLSNLKKYPYEPVEPFYVTRRNQVQLQCSTGKDLSCPNNAYDTNAFLAAGTSTEAGSRVGSDQQRRDHDLSNYSIYEVDDAYTVLEDESDAIPFDHRIVAYPVGEPHIEPLKDDFDPSDILMGNPLEEEVVGEVSTLASIYYNSTATI